MFPALITMIFSWLGRLDWEIAKEGPNQDRFFKNRVRFCVNKDTVYLMSHLRYFEMAVDCDDPALTGTASHVRKVFEDALAEVTKGMGYDSLGNHQYAFWCKSPKCSVKEKHFSVFKKADSTYMTCIRNTVVKSDLNAHQRVFIKK